MRRLASVLVLSALPSLALAATFDVPGGGAPLVTVAVPDAWSPNHSEDGVDAIAPDKSFNLTIFAPAVADCGAARDDALAFLTRNGLTIERATAKEAAQAVGKLAGAATTYAATEDGKARRLVVITAPLGARCLQIAQWGATDRFDDNAKRAAPILSSIKPAGKAAKPARP